MTLQKYLILISAFLLLSYAGTLSHGQGIPQEDPQDGNNLSATVLNTESEVDPAQNQGPTQKPQKDISAQFAPLQKLLTIERFYYYTRALADMMKKRGHTEISQDIEKLTPEEIADLLTLKEISEPANFDAAVVRILTELHKVNYYSPKIIKWDYNFLKNKLGESYRVVPVDETPEPAESHENLPVVSDNILAPEPPAVQPVTVKNSGWWSKIKNNLAGNFFSKPQPSAVAPVPITEPLQPVATAPAPSEFSHMAMNVPAKLEGALSFDGQRYISSRTTLALYWAAAVNHQKLEFHLGGEREFRDRLKMRNGKVVGEIKPLARNYNKIYLVKYPEDDEPRIAVTRIYGRDRLNHLLMQANFGNFEGLTPFPDHKADVYGDAAELAKISEMKFTEIFKVAPKADRVIIGQKAGIENVFRAGTRVGQFLNLPDDKIENLALSLAAPQTKKFKTLITDLKKDGIYASLKKLTALNDMLLSIEKSHPLNLNSDFKSSSMEENGLTFTDIDFRDAEGNPKRWRLVGNVWGDEILPIMKALVNTGHKEFSYIGTAGALPEKGINIGDVIMPTRVIGPTKSFEVNKDIPQTTGEPTGPPAEAGKTVVQVFSPLVESDQWIKNTTADVVDVETGYLDLLVEAGISPQVYLLVSDVLGSEQTLDVAESSKRKNAQPFVIEALLKQDKVSGVFSEKDGTLNNSPKTADAFYGYYLKQVGAEKAGQPFTGTALLAEIEKTQAILTWFSKEASKQGIELKVFVPQNLHDGSYNPKIHPLNIFVEPIDSTQMAKLQQLYAHLEKMYQPLSVMVGVHQANAPPPPHFFAPVLHPLLNKNLLLNTYAQGALAQGGLSLVVDKNGKRNLVAVTVPQKRNEESLSPSITASHRVTIDDTLLYFYPPTPKTQQVLDALGKFDQDLLKKENALKDWVAEYVVHDIDAFPDGSVSKITPILGADGNTGLRLDITRKASKSYAINIEEMEHINIMKGADMWKNSIPIYSTSLSYFELIEDAKLGSLTAKAAIAKFHLASVRMARDFSSPTIPAEQKEILARYWSLREQEAQDHLTVMEAKAKADLKLKKEQWDRQREGLKALEDAPEKLNHLVAKNDRAGVAKLLRAYLPWPLMEPIEAAAWHRWLEAIEFPIPEKRRLIYRGLDPADMKLVNSEGKPYYFSTMLLHNQGNYTRRLRSYLGAREKLADPNFLKGLSAETGKDHKVKKADSETYVKSGLPTLLTQLLSGHQRQAVGSPFVGASSEYFIGKRFSSGALTALAIDERRLLPSYSNESEREVLIPFIVFPDEVVHVVNADAVAGKVELDLLEFLKGIPNPAEALIPRLPTDIKPFEDYAKKVWVDYLTPTPVTEVSTENVPVETKAEIICNHLMDELSTQP